MTLRNQKLQPHYGDLSTLPEALSNHRREVLNPKRHFTTVNFRDQPFHRRKVIQSFPSGSVVKNAPAAQEITETWVQSLGQEDPLEEEMATHSSNLAQKISWTEEPGGLQSMGSQKSQT